MKTEVIDAVGVKMAGPDSPALAAAKARDAGGVALEVLPSNDVRSDAQRSQEYLVYTDEMRRRGSPAEPFEAWADRTRCGSFQSADSGLDHAALRAERMKDAAYRDEIRQLGRPRQDHGSVGAVSSRQAGILPTGRVTVSDAMVDRAQREGADRGQLLDTGLVRAMLEAALHG